MTARGSARLDVQAPYDPAADAKADELVLRQVRAALAEARAELRAMPSGGFLVVAQGGAVVRKFDSLGEIRRAIVDARRVAQGKVRA